MRWYDESAANRTPDMFDGRPHTNVDDALRIPSAAGHCDIQIDTLCISICLCGQQNAGFIALGHSTVMSLRALVCRLRLPVVSTGQIQTRLRNATQPPPRMVHFASANKLR